MAKRIEVTNGVFLITDTISSAIEVRTPAENITYTEYLSRIFFFLQIEDERTLGYLWSNFVDSGDNPFGALQDLLDWLDTSIGDAVTTPHVQITEYRADFDTPSLYIYSGYLRDFVPIILRTKDSLEDYATGVTDLETDWTNRLSLTYGGVPPPPK